MTMTMAAVKWILWTLVQTMMGGVIVDAVIQREDDEIPPKAYRTAYSLITLTPEEKAVMDLFSHAYRKLNALQGLSRAKRRKIIQGKPRPQNLSHEEESVLKEFLFAFEKLAKLRYPWHKNARRTKLRKNSKYMALFDEDYANRVMIDAVNRYRDRSGKSEKKSVAARHSSSTSSPDAHSPAVSSSLMATSESASANDF